MITEEDAIRIAKKLAEDQQWGWLEPTHTIFRKAWFRNTGKWEVYSNYLNRGTKVRVVVDAVTGNVIDKGYLSR